MKPNESDKIDGHGGAADLAGSAIDGAAPISGAVNGHSAGIADNAPGGGTVDDGGGSIACTALASSGCVKLERQGQVSTVWLCRPALRNAFDDSVIAALSEIFLAAGADSATRVIVLAGEGPAFCAGGDLNWMQRMAGYSHAENLADAAALAQMLRIVHDCPKPVIARVHGDCYAGGVGLAAACDIVVAGEAANFCLSETRIGLIPATIAPYVIRALGANAARRYFLSAEVFTAARARELGFVHELCSAAELDDTVARIARALCQASPDAVAASKRLVRDMAGRTIDEALVADTVRRIADIRASEQGREGVAAFLEKRKPAWLVQP